MATASGAKRPPLAFDAKGPCQFAPPKEFDGGRENFVEFAVKLLPYLFLRDAVYEKHARVNQFKHTKAHTMKQQQNTETNI